MVYGGCGEEVSSTVLFQIAEPIIKITSMVKSVLSSSITRKPTSAVPAIPIFKLCLVVPIER